MKFAGLGFLLMFAGCVWSQEAPSGFELRATVTAQTDYSRLLTLPPRDGAPALAGFHSILYPTWKLSRRWAISGALLVHSRPSYYEEFGTQGFGVKADILQAHLSYSRFWNNSSVVVRVGQLSSAFGSFLLRYDDKDNPLIGVPPAYGYYYQPVTTLGLAGAQVDATAGKLDARAQFVNSSPANPRSVFDRDQYGNWAAGAGFTIRQGLRVGASFYRGPYLDRNYPYYFPGEAAPRRLPATAYGLDAQWGRGPWTVYGEYQRFLFTYHAIPNYRSTMAYAEARRVLHPRWYIAARLAYSHDYESTREYESAIGFRPNRHQLLKIGYDVFDTPDHPGTIANRLAVQLVTVLRPISIARD